MGEETPEYFLIRYFVQRDQRKAYRFNNGLALAFSPCDEERPYTLAASRRDGFPSTREQAVVDAALKQVLCDRGIVIDGERPLVMRRELRDDGVGVCWWCWVVKQVRL